LKLKEYGCKSVAYKKREKQPYYICSSLALFREQTLRRPLQAFSFSACLPLVNFKPMSIRR